MRQRDDEFAAERDQLRRVREYVHRGRDVPVGRLQVPVRSDALRRRLHQYEYGQQQLRCVQRRQLARLPNVNAVHFRNMSVRGFRARALRHVVRQ